MKRWLCSVFGHIYDPENEDIPAEVRGAAICRYVSGHHEFTASRVGRKYRLLTRNMAGREPDAGRAPGDDGLATAGTG